jgi:hypothetical protein
MMTVVALRSYVDVNGTRSTAQTRRVRVRFRVRVTFKVKVRVRVGWVGT